MVDAHPGSLQRRPLVLLWGLWSAAPDLSGPQSSSGADESHLPLPCQQHAATGQCLQGKPSEAQLSPELGSPWREESSRKESALSPDSPVSGLTRDVNDPEYPE